jgi:hypothetical protein
MDLTGDVKVMDILENVGDKARRWVYIGRICQGRVDDKKCSIL